MSQRNIQIVYLFTSAIAIFCVWLIDSTMLNMLCFYAVVFIWPNNNFISTPRSNARRLVIVLGIVAVFACLMLSCKLVLTDVEYQAVNRKMNSVLWSKYLITGIAIIKIACDIALRKIDKMYPEKV